MKNALVYCVNGSKKHIERVVNSINSFAKYNQNLIQSTEVIVLTQEGNLDLRGIDGRINYRVVNRLSYDYEFIPKKAWGAVVYLKFEMFRNPIFMDYDNVLFLDADTEVVSSIEHLFVNAPGAILMPQDVVNFLKEYDFMPNGWRYFNSGTILVRPKVLGKHVMAQMFALMVSSMVKYYEIFEHADQDAFNYVFSRPEFVKFFVAIDDVPPKGQYRFGYQLKEELAQNKLPSEIAIIHHVGCNKKHPYKLRFLKQ